MQSTSLPEFLADLRQQAAGEVRTDAFSRTFYSTDASLYQVLPHGVLIPRSIEDVQAAVTLAARHGIPILPRGAGTSLAGQAVNAALVIDGSRHLDRVLEVNPDERWVRVQPGVVLDDLNRQLRPLGLQFGPDPASSDRATLGGVVSNNATGSHSILYGMTADHVLEAEVILADGSAALFGPLDGAGLAERQRREGLVGAIHRDIAALVDDPANQAVIRTGTPRHWRRAGGYNLDRFVGEGVAFHHSTDPRFNLARLICGAEGTLAAITALKLGLVPVPAQTGLALVHFEDLRSALLAVPIILAADPSAVELLDSLGLQLCRDVPTYARLLATFLDTVPEALLIVEFQGGSAAELRHKVARLQERLAAEKSGAAAFVPALDPARQANVWQVRKASLGLVMSLKGDVKPVPFIEDAAVPVEHLADYVAEIDRYLAGIGTRATYYAHASAGCLHIRPLIDTKRAREVAKMPDIARFSASLLRGYGGALSSEHGDGRTRSWLNEAFFGPELYRLFETVKRTFDPVGIFNPGNIVPSHLVPGKRVPVPSMTENLRYGEAYRVAPLQTALDFSAEQGFDRAVEMCNGAGVCRKRSSGAMCPSFMVTREEEHSTRGRANALRAAMSGLLPADALTSPRMYQVMDLCIECKACKSECPSAVDMAKLKFEFLARYHAAHGTPLRARLFGDIARISRLSSGRMAPLANWSLGNGVVRGLLERSVGIGRQRLLPAFARESFTAWFAQRGERERSRKVVLFNDTFNTYNTPEVAIAATEVLEAAGFEVVLPGHRCCGRPMISKGLVEQAREAARGTVERLAPFAAQGLPIVGLEPSCLLTLRDEYAYLLPGDTRVQQIAEAALTFEEFVAREADAGRLELVFAEASRHVLLHSHCHQKALVGSGPSLRALTLPPGFTVDEVDSGCCGMAGSFGYEAEHYEISLAMAERRLLPAVRAAGPDTLVVAAGTSCRQQIAHGSGRRAWHPAEVLRAALGDR